jgi:uncharacterized protein involved in response to NO
MSHSAAREIAAGRNWGNLKVVVIVSLLAVGNLLFHLEAHYYGASDYSVRLGIGAVVLLISIVGGRVVPSFTRNWLAGQAPGRMPRPFGRFDLLTLATSAIGLAFWVAAPFHALTGYVLGAAGLLHLVRLASWAGERTLANRLVLVLHVAYAFLPVGFLLSGCAAAGWLVPGAGIHAWTGGAVGTMTLAVMTRATLGHTGRALMASAGTQAIYVAVVIGALARICASFDATWSVPLLTFSGVAWTAAFLGFGVLYAPMLCQAKASTR